MYCMLELLVTGWFNCNCSFLQYYAGTLCTKDIALAASIYYDEYGYTAIEK